MQIASQAQINSFFKQKYSGRKTKIFGFYNSQLNKLIIQQEKMLLPIDDRLSTRGHGVFDVIYVKNLNIINLDAHIDRLYASASNVQIKPTITKAQLREIVVNVMKTVFGQYRKGHTEDELSDMIFGIRMVFSSGYGDFGIASLGKQSVFYLFVFEPYINRSVQDEGVKEYVVKYVKDIKSDLVHTKTTNYLQNAMMANASKSKGGYVGIKAFQSGILLQASIANIAFIFGKQFATPRFQTVIKGTTILKLLTYIQQLQKQGLIEKISFRDITVEEGEKADEMIILGGDKIVPVLSLNDKQISKGKGMFTGLFQKWYKENNQHFTKVQ